MTEGGIINSEKGKKSERFSADVCKVWIKLNTNQVERRRLK